MLYMILQGHVLYNVTRSYDFGRPSGYEVIQPLNNYIWHEYYTKHDMHCIHCRNRLLSYDFLKITPWKNRNTIVRVIPKQVKDKLIQLGYSEVSSADEIGKFRSGSLYGCPNTNCIGKTNFVSHGCGSVEFINSKFPFPRCYECNTMCDHSIVELPQIFREEIQFTEDYFGKGFPGHDPYQSSYRRELFPQLCQEKGFTAERKQRVLNELNSHRRLILCDDCG